MLVELRLQGDRLTALVDGAVVIEARDSRITAPGQWGLLADDGWFESVEVQTPPPAAANTTISSTLDARPLYAWTGPIAALSPRWPVFEKSADTLALLTFADDWLVREVKAKRLETAPK